jgi:predicted metalloprotease
MTSRLPIRLAAAAAPLLAAAVAWLAFGPSTASALDGDKPQTADQFLTSVIEDVDSYWTKQFADAGLPEPRVSYQWVPTGQAAEYHPDDDTIYVSQEFARAIYDGALDGMLPGSSHGYGRAAGDFAVAYIVAHEYGHQIQDELGLFERGIPTKSLELQADCYAGAWAKSADDANRLDPGDVDEAIEAALAVGDFETSNPAHHGTPEERSDAWRTGFRADGPAGCDAFLQAS